MKGQKICEYIANKKMPDIEAVRGKILSQRQSCVLRAVKAPKTHKRFVAVVVAVLLTLFIAGASTVAFGYGFFDIIKELIWNDPNYIGDSSNSDLVFSSDFIVYDSFDSLIEAEGLNIIYPTKLPDGYEFTDFSVAAFGSKSMVQAYSLEPKISFSVQIGENGQFDDYDYEINGIKYIVYDVQNGYAASWSYNGDYYSINTGDKAVVLEIINNLI